MAHLDCNTPFLDFVYLLLNKIYNLVDDVIENSLEHVSNTQSASRSEKWP